MNKDLYCVYIHKNKINGKIYVGRTCKKLKTRSGPNGTHYSKNTRFGKAISKYGWDNFEHIILAKDLSKEEADRLEIYYIQKFKTQNEEFGYNMSSGGGNNGGGHPCNEETRQKIGDANRGKVRSEEFKQKISEIGKGRIPWNKGKTNCFSYTMSEETKHKLSEARKGKPSPTKGTKLSEETKKKISDSLKGNTLSEDTKQKLKAASSGRKFINDGKKCIAVKIEDLDKYLKLGFVLGRLRKE
jgi:group I intron endonuclease